MGHFASAEQPRLAVAATGSDQSKDKNNEKFVATGCCNVIRATTPAEASANSTL